MAEKFRLNYDNITVFQHNSISSVRESLVIGRPNRVLITPLNYPYMHQHEIGFIDRANQAHLFSYNVPRIETPSPVTEAIPELTDTSLVHGYIKLSHVRNGQGQIYLRFSPEVGPDMRNREDFVAAEDRSFADWVEAAKEAIQTPALTPDSLLQYYRFLIKRPLVADVTVGAIHYVAVLGEHRTFTMEEIREAFADLNLKEQDNTTVADWTQLAVPKDW